MTLHWWMHWFWVTLLSQHLCSAGILAAPQSEELQLITTEAKPEVQPPSPSSRQGRAMYFTKTPYVNRTLDNTTRFNVTTPKPDLIEPSQNLSEPNPTATSEEVTELQTEEPIPTTTEEDIKANVTEKPAIDETTPAVLKRKNLTKNTEVIDNEGAAESRIVTEKPLSLETEFLQTRIPPSIEPSRRLTEEREGVDTGVVTAICFAVLVAVALVGSVSFVVYRRRYLNKPQTLNDKCSNPDSSGYLDDSTVRDNSEEMYSLDNDSFLNSLEAMTIQNYWTDTVKHTKL